ncbi:MAG TPA: hypothetical protein VH637_25045 [Streptosporangiaceae bacterium]|jgi:hypothetical protein
MGKKVRYAAATLGVVPALGMLAQPAAGALAPAHTSKQPAATSRKTVKTVWVSHLQDIAPLASTCTANKEYTLTDSGVHLKFWSKPVGSRTCIGTIEVSYTGPNAKRTGAEIINRFGTFCHATTAGTKITDGCHHVFRRASMRVIGSELNGNNIPFATVSDYFPFITN